MYKKVAGAAAVVIVLALILGGTANRADEFTEADMKRWTDEYMSVVKIGREWIEYRKLGRLCSEKEFGPYLSILRAHDEAPGSITDSILMKG